jgi:hypothetical protein
MAKAKHQSPKVTFHFRSKRERDYFMGQLSDGWGENRVDLLWDFQRKFHDCTDFKILLGQDELDELHRHEELKKKWRKK